MESIVKNLQSIPPSQHVSLTLSNNTTITGMIRKHIKKSITILNEENMIEFVNYDDIVSFHILSDDCSNSEEGQKCTSNKTDFSCSLSTTASAPTIGKIETTALSPPTCETTRHQKKKNKSNGYQSKIPIILDIETGDPDDILTLMFASCHPLVDLKAVTVSPGSMDQILLIKTILTELKIVVGRNIEKDGGGVRLGAQDWPLNQGKKGCVDLDFYGKFLFLKEENKRAGSGGRNKGGKSKSKIHGTIDMDEVSPASQLIKEVCDQERDVSLFTGGPLHNLGGALKLGAHNISRWVAQGGFCGDGVVPPGTTTLKKFEGLTHVQTWNFGGSRDATLLALSSQNIQRRVLVGKNVCHRCEYNDEFDSHLKSCVAEMKPSPHQNALEWIDRALSAQYNNSRGIKHKKLHDPLAFATLLDESVCALREVKVDVEKNSWGSSLCDGTHTFAAVDYSYELFMAALIGC